MNPVEVKGVTRRFGAMCAVDAVDLSIGAGELFGLIGHNGAGKTTLFRLMLGLITPDAGTVTVQGQPVHGAGFREVRRRIGFMPESASLYENLTGEETLAYFARLKRARPRIQELLERVGLGAAARRPVREYSKGMLQRLVFAQALLGEPSILFLDEPTHGLDPAGVCEFYQVLQELRSRGATVVITSHILAEIEQRVDRLALMASGRIRAIGSVHALRDELHLPVTFQLSLREGTEAALRAALGTLAHAVQVRGASASFQCAREGKVAVLAALSSLGGALLDLGIREPSLEDVFMGYRG